jgi:hypothetical protein
MADIEVLRTKFAEIENDLLAGERQNIQDLLIQVLLDECSKRNLKISIIPEAGAYRLELGSYPPKLYSDVYDLVAAAWNLLNTPDVWLELIGSNPM